MSEQNNGLTGAPIELPGGHVMYKPGGKLVVEKKDWDLIRANLNESIDQRYRKPDMMWGGIGLATGSLSSIIAAVQTSTYDWVAFISALLFAIGVTCILDALNAWARGRKDAEAQRNSLTDFLNQIEQESKGQVKV